MTAEVFDIRSGQPFIPSDPEVEAVASVAQPEPPAGLTDTECRMWWLGWEQRFIYEEQVTAARLVEIQQEIKVPGLRLVTVS